MKRAVSRQISRRVYKINAKVLDSCMQALMIILIVGFCFALYVLAVATNVITFNHIMMFFKPCLTGLAWTPPEVLGR